MEVLPTAQPISTDHAAPLSVDNGPVVMSFPAVLRNPGLTDRFAHLRATAERVATVLPVAPKKGKRDEKEGKRWIRRKENARFVGNAHIVLPSKRDYTIPAPHKQPTFPQPLPNYLSRNNAVPPAVPTIREPSSANAGRFSLSLKGMRRELRKAGPKTELLVKEVESEILAWLRDGGVILSPDAAAEMSFPGMPVGSSELIREVSRTPLQLVWSIEEGAFTRYVVHCCARYHEVVSYSKDMSGQRLTYLLRPNVTRPNFRASVGIDTPPVTDLETSAYEFNSESDFVSDSDYRSGAEADSDAEPALQTRAHPLSAIVETFVPPSQPITFASAHVNDDEWSVIDADADIEDDSEVEGSLSASVGSLVLRDPDRTPRAEPRLRQASLHSRLWERQRRSASSPSRSPARRLPQRIHRIEPPCAEQLTARRSFHDYLFT